MEMVLKTLRIPDLKVFLKERDEKIIAFLKKYWPHFISANMVTASRFPLLIPIYFLMREGREYYATTMLLVALSGILDLLDGPVARAQNKESNLGKFMDPLADKIVILLPLWLLLLPAEINARLFLGVIAILTIIEFFLMFKRTVTLMGFDIGETDIRSSLAGKIKSFSEFFALGAVLVGLGIQWLWLFRIGFVLIVLSCILATLSLLGHLAFHNKQNGSAN